MCLPHTLHACVPVLSCVIHTDLSFLCLQSEVRMLPALCSAIQESTGGEWVLLHTHVCLSNQLGRGCLGPLLPEPIQGISMWSIGVTGDKHVEHWCDRGYACGAALV